MADTVVIASQQQQQQLQENCCDLRNSSSNNASNKIRRKAKDREKLTTLIINTTTTTTITSDDDNNNDSSNSSNSHTIDDDDNDIIFYNTGTTNNGKNSNSNSNNSSMKNEPRVVTPISETATTITGVSNGSNQSVSVVQQQQQQKRSNMIFGRRRRRTNAYSTIVQSDEYDDDDNDNDYYNDNDRNDIIMQETDDGTLMIVDRNYCTNTNKKMNNNNNSRRTASIKHKTKNKYTSLSTTTKSTKRQLSDDNNVDDNNNNTDSCDRLNQQVQNDPTPNGGNNNTNSHNGKNNKHQHDYTTRQRLLTIAGIAGNVLEWYDFAVFGYFSDILGEVFFPPPISITIDGSTVINNNDHTQTMKSFLIFGIAFIFRPLGGIIFGYIGDKYNRRLSLIISIFCMAIPTLCLGCLPNYNTIGYYSPLLLLLVRIVQGLSVGGQLISSLVYTLENHSYEHWGFYGSFVMAAANVGTFLGGTTGYILRKVLTHEQLVSWGWRIPFLIGFSVSFAGCSLHVYGKYDDDDDDESFGNHNNNNNGSKRNSIRPVHNGNTTGSSINRNGGIPVLANTSDYDDSFSGTSTSNSEGDEFPKNNYLNGHNNINDDDDDDDIVIITTRSNPCLRAIQRDNIRPLIAATLVPMLWTAGFYLAFVWMSVYMSTLSKHPISGSYGINSIALLCSVTFFFPIAGTLSDRYGRVRVMTIGGTGMAIIAPLMFYIIGLGNTIHAFIGQCTIGILLSLWGGPMCSWLVESFEPEARLTSVAIGYNLAHALVGSATPAFATWLVDNSTNQATSGIIFTILAILSLFGLHCVAPTTTTVSLQNKYRRHRGTNVNNNITNTKQNLQLSSFVEIEMNTKSTRTNNESGYTNEEIELV